MQCNTEMQNVVQHLRKLGLLSLNDWQTDIRKIHNFSDVPTFPNLPDCVMVQGSLLQFSLIQYMWWHALLWVLLLGAGQCGDVLCVKVHHSVPSRAVHCNVKVWKILHKIGIIEQLQYIYVFYQFNLSTDQISCTSRLFYLLFHVKATFVSYFADFVPPWQFDSSV